MMKKGKTIIFLLVFIFFVQAEIPTIEQNLANIVKKYQLIGISVVVAKDNEILFSYYQGNRDISRGLPVNENTKYRVASVSKMIVSTAIMQLWEKKLLNLEDDVSQYLGFQLVNPNFPQEIITFEKLLSHTSSLRDTDEYSSFLVDTYQKNPVPHLKDLVLPDGTYYTEDLFSKEFGPKSNYFTYANINFVILGTLIEKISGIRFDQYCEKYILQPLEITGSFRVQSLPDINQLSVIYRNKNNKWVPQVDNYQGVCPPRDVSQYILGTNGALFAPQGGLRISALELSKFWMGYKKILLPETIYRMQKTVWMYNGNNGDTYENVFKNYALGHHTTQDLIPKQELIGHPGDAYGLVSNFYFSPNKNCCIIFITNGGIWDKGNYSGWFNVEEDVFLACQGFLN